MVCSVSRVGFVPRKNDCRAAARLGFKLYSPLGFLLNWKTDELSVRLGCICKGFSELYSSLGF